LSRQNRAADGLVAALADCICLPCFPVRYFSLSLHRPLADVRTCEDLFRSGPANFQTASSRGCKLRDTAVKLTEHTATLIAKQPNWKSGFAPEKESAERAGALENQHQLLG
jgi:hypothetical protein